MYDRFSERARKVVLYAREEAARLNYDFIGTEHLLLGLLREGASIGVIVLRRLEVDINLLRDEIKKFIIQDGDRARVEHDIQLTPRAKRVLELAMDEAGRMGHNFVGTEHILLGLLREGEGIASRVLKNFGVTPDRVRSEVVRLLSGDLEGDLSGTRGKTGQKSSPLDDFSRDLTR
ncbi:MAG TPA: Clp protease N-terminal domain-containing protein, partial [Candidatus Mcinerneyibacteriales bacterium]|nr:Clp protease N-terminal domain-containing protein [Candidatus Mcinerneyibacteriales bacterium]